VAALPDGDADVCRVSFPRRSVAGLRPAVDTDAAACLDRIYATASRCRRLAAIIAEYQPNGFSGHVGVTSRSASVKNLSPPANTWRADLAFLACRDLRERLERDNVLMAHEALSRFGAALFSGWHDTR
jgi:hypothetical protein